MKAVIAVGTNIGNRIENIKNAIGALNLVPNTKVIQVSKIYETDPWGYEDQAQFLNGALLVETELSKKALLGVCLGIEAGLGRVREIKNGPRILDLDLLYYEDETSDTEELTLPHPGILERAFVLIPLSDLFPNGIAFHFDFQTALQTVDKSTVHFYQDI